MKKTALLCMFAIGLLFLVKCSKPKTTPPGGATGVTVLPWEFDITINNYTSHFKSTSKSSKTNFALIYITAGKARIILNGESKLDPEYIAGDVMSCRNKGTFGGSGISFDEGLGSKKPVSNLEDVTFDLRTSSGIPRISFIDTSFEVIVKDMGKPYEPDYNTATFINGRAGQVEIPTQKRRCYFYTSKGLIDTFCTISGKIIFSGLK